ncbi:hypothetical protein RND81_10G125600 [Saponaria officinalis]|uniref:DDT domain-containing protein n=1 Tax=Saponaria officinalis TaxID=3572 RepID=A0AAW1I1L3_SAPOF
MAVSSSPVAESKKTETQKQSKRTKCPGVRVVGGRIYDSQNGKTCHQCRQKTMDFTARCKNMKNEKQCTIMFCHKCLINRYGEKAEDMAVLDDWNCPKCRDICNCSFCMKKKGHKPTGILVHAAKATGFTSVSQLLDVKGPNVSKELAVKSKVSSPKKPADLTKGSPLKRGKENSVDGICDPNSNSSNASPAKKAKKTKGGEVKEKDEVRVVDEAVTTPKKHNVVSVLRRSPRQFALPHECKEDMLGDEKTNALRRSPRKSNVSQEVTKKEEKLDSENLVIGLVAKNEKKTKVEAEGKAKEKKTKVEAEGKAKEKKTKVEAEGKAKEKKTKVEAEGKTKEKKTKVDADEKLKKNKLKEDTSTIDYALDVALPPGTLLTNVSGIDLDAQDAGYVLQFLEFCSSFGEVLAIRKGQPENVLRDILCRRTRKGKCSSSVLFIIQLLSFMGEHSEEESPSSLSTGENSWIHSLKSCLNEAQLAPEDIPEDWFDKGRDRYELLDSSQKLRLLTFLCDEALSTEQMRNWIEEENLKFVEKGKEAKESLNAAKEKEKLIKRKLQEDIVKALIAKNGAPLTVSEHESIVAEVKAESKRVQDEIMDAMGLVSKKRQRSDAVRTEPIIIDDDGRACWRLKCLGDTSLLLQDVGAIEEVTPNDKWFSFDDAEMKIVEKYMSSVRLKRHRINKQAQETMIKRSGSGPEGDSSSNDDSPAVAITS